MQLNCLMYYYAILIIQFSIEKKKMNPPPSRPPPKLPKISVVNKSQKEEAFELRSQLEEIYQYWSVCL